MRAPLRIAFGAGLANVVLDAILIFGLGSIPALGIAGAAWATTASQVLGVVRIGPGIGQAPTLAAS